MFASLKRRVLGQSGSEYMMVISVVTIAVVGAAYMFVPQFHAGTLALGNDVKDILGTGSSDGRGVANGSTAGGNATDGGDSTGGDTGSGGLGNPADPTGSGNTTGGNSNGSGSGGGAGSGSGNANGSPNRDTRYQRNNQTCIFGICFGTRETAVGAGTGGGGGETTVAQGQAAELGSDSDKIDGAWKSFFQGDVSTAASKASEALKDNPICGPAIIAALTGQDINKVYSDLENNGRLALVKKETVVAGVTVNTEYTTTGVMSQNQLADALRNDYGFQVTTTASGANIADVQRALDKGKTPIVLISDSRSGDSNAGDFGVVTDIVPGMGVKIDSSTGSYWIPQGEFERRMGVMGGRLVTATPPRTNSQSVASGP